MGFPRAGFVGLSAASLLGAGLALGVTAGLGRLSGSTTTVRELVSPPAQPSANASFRSTQTPLTIHEIYASAAPGVVQVTSTSVVQQLTDPFFGAFGAPTQWTQRALGSGFVIDKAGDIVTNDHVVAGARSVLVSFSDKESMKATVVGVDPSTDIVVLNVGARSRALTPLLLGNSDSVQVGDPVVAIGNPFGLDRSITAGIVSALQRPITAPNGFTIDHVIQTDAALNHGNSGGPLLDSQGQVIGVDSQIQSGGGDGTVGIGFAIPINAVKQVAAQLIKNGRAEHAFLGIDAKPVTSRIAKLFHLPVSLGLLVGRVCRFGGAAQAGVRRSTNNVVVAGESWPLGGDLIIKADGERLSSVDRLRSIVAAKRPGDHLMLALYRGTKKLTLDIKLGRQPLVPRC